VSRGPLVQVVLVVCGVLPILVCWDEQKHEAALVWAAGWTACCWLLVPGWARWPMLALTASALLITTRAVRRGRAQRHAAQRVERERELDLLLACAQREQLTTIETVPARLGAYAHASRLLAANDLDRLLPPPPSEPRPGPGDLWERLDDTHRIAVAAHIAADAGLARPGAVTEALRRVSAAAEELASALEGELRAAPGNAVALTPAKNPWLRAGGGAA
jgi:hypothetical protein